MILLPDNYWEVKATENKGKGLFAKKTISKATLIGDYLGIVLHPKDAMVNEKNFYLMYYHDLAVISPNFKRPGTHLLNHSCVPNCFIYIYKGHTLVFARNNILKGEEFTIPYLLPPIDKFCNPCLHICDCGNLECTGTMHLSKSVYKRWRKLTDKQSQETKRERIKYGKELPLLLDYPKIIPKDYIQKVELCYNSLHERF